MVNLKRNSELDFMRGIAVLGVVAIHISAQLVSSTTTDNYSQLFSLIINQLSRFCVPTFLFVSGFLAYKSYQKRSYFSLIKSKIPSLVVPYIAWTLISFGMGFPHSIYQTIIVFLTGSGSFSQLYYIPLLFQGFLLLPVLIALGKSIKITSFILVITILITGVYEWNLIYYYADWLKDVSFLFRSTIFVWIIYFILGIYVSIHYSKVKNYINNINKKFLIITFIAAAIFLLIDCYFFMNKNNLSEFVWFFRPTIIVYSLITILLLLSFGINFESRIINKIYENSFGIYLSHVGVIFVIHKFAGFLFSNILFLAISFIITVVCSYFITEIIKKTPLALFLLGEKIKKTDSINNSKNKSA